MTEFPKTLLDAFVKWVEISVDERGVYPFPAMMFKRGEGEGLTVCALDLKPEQCLDFFWKQIATAECTAIIMGLDRYTKPGQGTEFKDVITVFSWYDDPDKNAWHTIGTAVINYQHDPRIVRPLDYENAYWNERMRDELRQRRPAACVRVKPDGQ